MTGVLFRLGGACARRHRLVLLAWVVALAGLAGAAIAVGSNTADKLTLPGTDGQAATDLLEDRFPTQANGTNPVVLRVPEGRRLDQGADRQAVADLAERLRDLDGVRAVVTPLEDAGRAQITRDGRIAYLSLNLEQGASDLTEDEAQTIVDAAATAGGDGREVATGGYVGQKVSKPATHDSEAIGIAAAIVVLLLTFGTVVAMGLPLLTAIMGLGAGLSLVALAGQIATIPTIAPTLATMTGLGVGIDYALFIVTRHKAQLQGGMAMGESIARATATAGGAVVFAGTTVVIALASLALTGIPLVALLGVMAAISVLVAVVAAVTLLPALLGLAGTRIDALRLPMKEPEHDDRPHGWARWARAVAARPVLAILGSIVLLGVLSVPALQLHLGQSDVGALPEDTQARQSYDLMTTGFGAGSNGPLLVAADLERRARPGDARLDDVRRALAGTDGVASVSPAALNDRGDLAVFSVVSRTAPSSDDTEALVDRLRDDTAPAAERGNDLQLHVGGRTAGFMDLADQIGAKLPSIVLVVIGLSFVVLLLAFRSVAIPLKAGLMNLVSIGASFGVVTAVFQLGWGAELIGLDGPVPVLSFVPLLMFVILFGLSMDYEVFLMSQMKEHYGKHRDNHEAVVDGLAATGRVITSAALIMVAVFASFILNGDPTVKQFGVGLAVAIAVDATIVRCILVPGVMVLMGDSNWWMPRWLDRMTPSIPIEGEEFFAERDAALALAAADAPAEQDRPPAVVA